MRNQQSSLYYLKEVSQHTFHDRGLPIVFNNALVGLPQKILLVLLVSIHGFGVLVECEQEILANLPLNFDWQELLDIVLHLDVVDVIFLIVPIVL